LNIAIQAIPMVIHGGQYTLHRRVFCQHAAGASSLQHVTNLFYGHPASQSCGQLQSQWRAIKYCPDYLNILGVGVIFSV
jgi:hypothetical protein